MLHFSYKAKTDTQNIFMGILETVNFWYVLFDFHKQ